MIQLAIRKTNKSYNPKSQWQYYDFERKQFENVKKAKAWINDTYGNSRKSSMYIDDKDGKSKKIGYVIGFRNYDFVDGKRENFIEQHWIGFETLEVLHI
mgnify:FL=1